VQRIKWNDVGENHFIIAVAFGIGALTGLSASIRSSGGHLNPGVTVTLAIVGRFPPNQVWYYVLAQYSGSFLAACILYLQYYDVIGKYVDTHASAPNSTRSSAIHFASFFTTFPAPHVSLISAFIDQVRD